jgi:hypothetical protein
MDRIKAEAERQQIEIAFLGEEMERLKSKRSDSADEN